MADVFSIIGRRMHCQTEFHRQRAIALAGLDIGQQLGFPGFYIKIGIQGATRIGDAVIGGRFGE
jgi:hypothetical protein